MRRCATCIHAVRSTRKTSYGELLCAVAGSSHGEPRALTTKAYALDEHEYRADLVVSPDFGCVLHEER